MRFMLKSIIGVPMLCAVIAAGVLADALLNQGRLFGSTFSRPGLETSCLPELRRELADRGFAPGDIEFATRPAPWIVAPWGWARTFESSFSFQDGAEATRVDGHMSCRVDRSDVHVEVRTSATPIRAS